MAMGPGAAASHCIREDRGYSLASRRPDRGAGTGALVKAGNLRFGLPGLSRPSEAAGAAGGATRAAVFTQILTSGPVARTELATRLRLSQSTITKSVNPLLELGYLAEVGTASSGNGRPRQMLQVVPERRSAIGITLGPNQITGVVTDLQATVTARRRLAMPSGYDPAAAAAAVDALVAGFVDERPEISERLLGVGVGLGGHVDTVRTGRVFSGILGWQGVDLTSALAKRLALPVVVNNDANALAVAEHWFGHGRAAGSFAVVTVGVGIGCGLILNGQLHTGVSGAAAELGHIPVVPDGPRCDCGNRGCLESVIGDAGLLRDIRERGGAAFAGMDDAREAARTADPAALAAFEAMGTTLGRALATMCNLLNLETIVLTGEGAVGYDLFGPSCERAMRGHGFSTAAADCALIPHVADHNLWARGAACLAICEAVKATAD
jgi:predicted NBD/HSP70 family sugar kinase